MLTAVELLLAAAVVPALAASGYLALLAAASLQRASFSGAHPRLRFDLIVPAHNEEAGVAETVHNLLSLDYPRELVRVIVVADNCSDETSARAAAAGAQVLVRDDPERRGKGYALSHAFAHSLRGDADAMVVIDADTIASANLLQAFALRIASGARAIQADYGVRNPRASWRTRLMTLALAMFHGLRSLGRERLGLSCGLRGNGMCFTRQILLTVPHQAFSIVEDLEYGVRLGEAGYRVHYAGDAHVYGEMVTAGAPSASQRRRWEGGRWQFTRDHAARLLITALARRDKVLLDLAIDLIVPPLSLLALVIAFGFFASLGVARMGGGTLALSLWTGAAAGLVVYALRGWSLSRTGLRGLLDLCSAPAYVAWKLALLLGRRKQRNGEWIRTTREAR
jgi:1,2-diacylglycerol 3-beta-glucosyltransferase